VNLDDAIVAIAMLPVQRHELELELALGCPMMRFIAVIALVWIPVAPAQTSTPSPSPYPILRARSNLVLVPVLVRTKTGELVFTLTAKDFTITDDGIDQKVELEENTDNEPLALVVAVETGGGGARQLDKYRHLATTIEAVLGDVPRRIAVVGFDSVPKLLQDFTSDLEVVDGAIHRLSPGNGGAAIVDGLGFSLDLLRDQPPEYRRAILLLSETIDRGSHMKLDEALREISDTNTTIYSLAFSSTKSDVGHYASEELPIAWDGKGLSNPNPQHPGGCMAKDPNADPGTSQNKLSQAYDCLGQLAPPLAAVKMAAIAAIDGMRHNAPETVARLTGGEYFRFSNTHDLESGLITISNHVPNRYVLSFQPRSPHPGLHSIVLRLRGYPNLVVTARRSYWADRDAPNEPGPEPRP
jgi:VWFA-related protein